MMRFWHLRRRRNGVRHEIRPPIVLVGLCLPRRRRARAFPWTGCLHRASAMLAGHKHKGETRDRPVRNDWTAPGRDQPLDHPLDHRRDHRRLGLCHAGRAARIARCQSSPFPITYPFKELTHGSPRPTAV